MSVSSAGWFYIGYGASEHTEQLLTSSLSSSSNSDTCSNLVCDNSVTLWSNLFGWNHSSSICCRQVTAGCWLPSPVSRWTRSCCTELFPRIRASPKTTPASSTSRLKCDILGIVLLTENHFMCVKFLVKGKPSKTYVKEYFRFRYISFLLWSFGQWESNFL